jgi:hypothetical protein
MFDFRPRAQAGESLHQFVSKPPVGAQFRHGSRDFRVAKKNYDQRWSAFQMDFNLYTCNARTFAAPALESTETERLPASEIYGVAM